MRSDNQMATFSSSANTNYYPEIQSELLSGESLLWCGQPLQRIIFHQRDLFSIPFSLLWGGFAIFWEWGVTGHFGNSSQSRPAPGFFALWGIPFVVMGQYLMWGRFLYTAWRKGRTFYAITNKRVLVVSIGMSRKVIDGYFRNLDSAALSIRSDGVGTIDFAPAAISYSNWGLGRGGRGQQIDIDLSSLSFFDIADARSVYQLIQTQREQASGKNE
jgi:hypothetical protein